MRMVLFAVATLVACKPDAPGSHDLAADDLAVAPNADLAGADLAGADLASVVADLAGADLAGADLASAAPDLAGVDLAGVDLAKTYDLHGCSASESQCGDNFDNDCDFVFDCSDSDCNGMPCTDEGDPCTVDVCNFGQCVHVRTC